MDYVHVHACMVQTNTLIIEIYIACTHAMHVHTYIYNVYTYMTFNIIIMYVYSRFCITKTVWTYIYICTYAHACTYTPKPTCCVQVTTHPSAGSPSLCMSFHMLRKTGHTFLWYRLVLKTVKRWGSSLKTERMRRRAVWL